jgi:hypothetical protein
MWWLLSQCLVGVQTHKHNHCEEVGEYGREPTQLQQLFSEVINTYSFFCPAWFEFNMFQLARFEILTVSFAEDAVLLEFVMPAGKQLLIIASSFSGFSS